MKTDEEKPVIAVAVYCTESGHLYDYPLYSKDEIESVRKGTHPDLNGDEKVIIVHPNMMTESYT